MPLGMDLRTKYSFVTVVKRKTVMKGADVRSSNNLDQSRQSSHVQTIHTLNGTAMCPSDTALSLEIEIRIRSHSHLSISTKPRNQKATLPYGHDVSLCGCLVTQFFNCKVAGKCDSPQSNLKILFHNFANLNVKEKFQHRVPHVVFIKIDRLRRCERR